MYRKEKEITVAEPFFIINPMLNTNNRIYIWETDIKSKDLFVQLCSLGIEVQGFVEIQPEIDSFFHKPIYNYNEVKDNELLISIDASNELLFDKVLYFEPIITNSNFENSKFVIYGAGAIGVRIKKYLENRGFEVICFIDTNQEKVNSFIDGIQVLSKDSLKSMKDIVVLEAGQYWKEIDKVVFETNDKLDRYRIDDSFFLDIIENTNEIIVDYSVSKTLSVNHALMNLDEHFSNKKIIIYDDDVGLSKKYEKIMRLLGYNDTKVTNNITKINEEELKIGEHFFNKLSNNFIILVESQDKANYLLNIGLLEGIHFTSINYPSIDYYFSKTMKLDVMLGYTYDFCRKDNVYDGYFIYGNNKKGDYRILVLGGSNTETNRAPFPCWVEILYNKYFDHKNITVFNGAISGYTSSQELIKLIRDIDLIQPDLVLSYSGYNDLYQYVERKNTPFNVPISKRIFLQYAKNENLEIANMYNREGIRTACNNWLKHINYMEAISRINRSGFLAFMQPLIYTKNYHNRHEQKLVKMLNTLFSNEFINECNEYIKLATKMNYQYKYIYNFTSIFDKEDVYMDICHVNEEGNKIIADNIWKIIENIINR